MSNFLKYKRQKSEKHLKFDSHLQYLHGACQTSGREQEKTSNKTRIHPDYYFFFNQQTQTNQKTLTNGPFRNITMEVPTTNLVHTQ